MKKTTLISFLLYFIGFTLSAQSVDYMQSPSKLRWRMIQSKHYTILFSDSLYKEAQRVTNLMEYLYRPVSKSLNDTMSRWSIILNSTYAESNGYVALAPKRSQWYPVPPQTGLLGTGEWYQLLATHETRHMAQIDRMNHGLARIFNIFGESGRLGYSIFTVPAWFDEGDAVCTETALSETGRGRMPSFERDMRLLLLTNQKYSYQKAYLGSYKDYFPNHYNLGYHLNTYIRKQNGEQVIDNLYTKVTHLSTLSRSLKKVTGFNTIKTYQKAMKELDSLWNQQLSKTTISEAKLVNLSKKKVWTEYQYPQYINDSVIIALKSGLADASQLVQISDGGNEKKLRLVSTSDPISVNGQKIAWSEIFSNIRWGEASTSKIVIYDYKTKRSKSLQYKNSLYSPALSSDGKLVAAIEFKPSRTSALVIMEISSGKVIFQQEIADNEFISTPSWSSDSKSVVYTQQGLNGKSVWVLTYADQKTQKVLDYSYEDITSPKIWNNILIYNSPASGIDNIYALNLVTLQKYQITSRKFGAYNASISYDQKSLLFTDFVDQKGSVIAQVSLQISTWKPIIENVENQSIKYYETLIKQEQGRSILNSSEMPKENYATKNYNLPSHFLNFHSWYLIPNPYYLWFTAESNNILNTSAINANMYYDFNQKTSNYSIAYTYSGLYPILQIAGVYNKRITKLTYTNGAVKNDFWNEKGLKASVTLPFIFSRGANYTQLFAGIDATWLNVAGKDLGDKPVFTHNNGALVSNRYFVDFTHLIYPALRDVKPKGVSVNLAIYDTPYSQSEYNSVMYSSDLRLYLRGIGKHHSLNFETGYEYQSSINYHFASNLLFPRGYTAEYFDKFLKLSANYEMPLLYPDLSVFNFVYVKRIKANFFYDYGKGSYKSHPTNYSINSMGVEIMFNTNWFNILGSDIELGGRFTYLKELKTYASEFVIFGLSF